MRAFTVLRPRTTAYMQAQQTKAEEEEEAHPRMTLRAMAVLWKTDCRIVVHVPTRSESTVRREVGTGPPSSPLSAMFQHPTRQLLLLLLLLATETWTGLL